MCSLKKCVCKVKSRAENGSVQHADHRSSTRNSAGQIRVGVQKFAQFGKRQPRAVQFRKTTGRAPVHKPRTRCTLCKKCKTGDSQRLVMSEMGVGFYRKTGPERGSATGRSRHRVPRSARIRVLYIRTCVQPRSMEALCVPQLEVWGAHSGVPFPGAGPAYFQEPSIRSRIPDATSGPCFHTFMLPGAVLTLKRVATSCGAACGPPIENGFCKSAGRFPTMISGHSSQIRAQSEVSRS